MDVKQEQIIEEEKLNQYAIDCIRKDIEEITDSIKHVEFLDSLNEQISFQNVSEEDIINRIRILTQKVKCFISRRDCIDLEMAENDFIKSNTFQQLQNKKTELWKQSVEKIYIQYKTEKLIKLSSDKEILNTMKYIAKEINDIYNDLNNKQKTKK